MRVPIKILLTTRQWWKTPCTIATFRLAVHTLTDRRLSVQQCRPFLGMEEDNLCMWYKAVPNALRELGLGAEPIWASEEAIDAALAEGALVIARDCLTWNGWHVVVVTGDKGSRYTVVDTLWGWPTRRRKKYVVASANHPPGRREATAIVVRKK